MFDSFCFHSYINKSINKIRQTPITKANKPNAKMFDNIFNSFFIVVNLLNDAYKN